MASYLEKQGERVALLAMLDSRADNHIRAREEGEEDVDAEEVVLKEAITVGDMDRQRTDLLLDRTRRVSRNIRRISRTEAPRVFKGDLLILRATIPSKGDGKLLSPEDWRPYVLGEIEVRDVESEHARMLMPESTVVIGRVLCQKLNELQELHYGTLIEVSRYVFILIFLTANLPIPEEARLLLVYLFALSNG
ncbi:unnamed protein product [Mortierella alpina]